MHDIVAEAGALYTRILDADGLRSLDATAWDRLSAEALVSNPFYARQYVLAGLETIDRDLGLCALVVQGERGELIGLFPFRVHWHPPFPWRVAHGADNLYQFSGTPLVARGHAAKVIGAWLDTLGGPKGPGFWTLANFDMGSPLKGLIDEAARKRRLRAQSITPYPRPHLTRLPGGLSAHEGEFIAKSRLKDIQRNLRRLREMGTIAFERASEPDLVRLRLDQFLTMEAAGWKGEGGTAFLSHAPDAAFARLAFGGQEEMEGLAAIDSLLLDGKPIAMSINIASGTTAFTPKCTYDETLRKQSPGLVLEYLVIERFYQQNEFADMDAATTTGGHVVLGLWNGQKHMGRLIVGPDDWRTDVLARGWTAAHDGRQALKRLLKRA